jgi:hypothetical protein
MSAEKQQKSKPSAGLALSSAQSRCRSNRDAIRSPRQDISLPIQRALPLGRVLVAKILGPVAQLTICCWVHHGRSPFPANGLPRVEFRISCIARGMSVETPRQATIAGRLSGKKDGPVVRRARELELCNRLGKTRHRLRHSVPKNLQTGLRAKKEGPAFAGPECRGYVLNHEPNHSGRMVNDAPVRGVPGGGSSRTSSCGGVDRRGLRGRLADAIVEKVPASR